jgi:iron complex transport system substrate-binding protein/vitamin B12 transport system substrate-binding protein
VTGRPLALALLLALVSLRSFGEPAQALPRVVSLNPSLTEILLALDAEPALVGIDDWSARDRPELASLPRVGGLFNPSLEGILALEPDLVVWVPSAQQRNLRERLEALGIEVLVLENITLAQVLDSIERLGARVQRAQQARLRVRAIRKAWTREQRRAQRGPHPRTVLVLQRDPLFVVGGGSFLDAMLRAAGAENAAGEFEEAYPRVGVEWLIAAAPQLIIDAAEGPERAREHWSRWPSLPAVAAGRVVTVPPDTVTLPGPQLDRAVALLGRVVRGEVAGSAP